MAGDAGVDEQDIEPPEFPAMLSRRLLLGPEASLASDAIASTPLPSSFIAFSSVVEFFPVIATRAPSAKNIRAVSSPMPVVPPVISALSLSRSASQFPPAQVSAYFKRVGHTTLETRHEELLNSDGTQAFFPWEG